MSKKNSSGVLSDENLEKAAGGWYTDSELQDIFGKNYFNKDADNDQQDKQLKHIKELADSAPKLQNTIDIMKEESDCANRKDADFYKKIMNI